VNGIILYAYDEAGHLLGEYDGTGGLIKETVWLGDIPVATVRGLHQNGRRWYDPAIGGYSQSEPLGLAAESHTTYAYVGSNPVSLVDPFGLWAAVAVSGNQVSITLPIQYSGPGVSPDRIRDWNKAIERAWTGASVCFELQLITFDAIREDLDMIEQISNSTARPGWKLLQGLSEAVASKTRAA